MELAGWHCGLRGGADTNAENQHHQYSGSYEASNNRGGSVRNAMKAATTERAKGKGRAIGALWAQPAILNKIPNCYSTADVVSADFSTVTGKARLQNAGSATVTTG